MGQYLVTGASQGIGYQTARHLASAGNRVIATSRNTTNLVKLRDSDPDNIRIHAADLSMAMKIPDLIEACGTLDGIVHAAGALVNKPFTDIRDADWMRMWEVNVMSTVRLVRAALPILNPGAHIVLLSSMGGFQGSSKYPGLSAYSASKGALSVLAECLAVELAPRQVSVNALALGAVQTDMLAQAFPGYIAPVGAEEMGAYIATFATSSGGIMNGRVLPVARFDP
jgi:3-oxoacyl-[acyl-carrier protein] reductase